MAAMFTRILRPIAFVAAAATHFGCSQQKCVVSDARWVYVLDSHFVPDPVTERKLDLELRRRAVATERRVVAESAEEKTLYCYDERAKETLAQVLAAGNHSVILLMANNKSDLESARAFDMYLRTTGVRSSAVAFVDCKSPVGGATMP